MAAFPAASAMSRRLQGRTIIITGASSGIGRSTALEFARTAPSNLKLILTARRLERLHELQENIRKEVGEGVKCLCVKLDVGSEKEVAAFGEKLKGLAGEGWAVDVLVNNA